MAPEVSLGISYKPFAPDIWSMGIVFLDVLCCRDILSKALGFPPIASNDPQKKIKQVAMAKKIRTFFECPASVVTLLSQFCDPRLKELGRDFAELLSNEGGMLVVDASQRLTAGEIRSGWVLDE